MNSELMKRLTVFAISAGIILLGQFCGDPEGPPDPVIEPEINKAVIDPAVSYQEMIGFGGSLHGIPRESPQALRRSRYASYSSRTSELI